MALKTVPIQVLYNPGRKRWIARTHGLPLTLCEYSTVSEEDAVQRVIDLLRDYDEAAQTPCGATDSATGSNIAHVAFRLVSYNEQGIRSSFRGPE